MHRKNNRADHLITTFVVLAVCALFYFSFNLFKEAVHHVNEGIQETVNTDLAVERWH